MTAKRRLRKRPIFWLRDEPHVPLGYFCAINAATLSYVVVNTVPTLREAGPADRSLGEWLMPVFAMMLLGTFFWFFGFIAGIAPLAVIWTLARRLRINNVFYYLAGGALTGIILTPLANFFFNVFLITWDSPERTVLVAWMEEAPRFAFVGVCGALAFWYKAGRHVGRRELKHFGS